jgi:uncharacterized protein YqgQ
LCFEKHFIVYFENRVSIVSHMKIRLNNLYLKKKKNHAKKKKGGKNVT